MILARNSITLHHVRDITAVVWYYKLQASTITNLPDKPTTATPTGWTTTEPSYTEGSTNSLYVVQKTTFSDGSFEYSDVSLSSSYEAAKAAYNKSVQAKETADAALQQSVWYATCDTAAGTTAKVATITPATTEFVLQAGAVVNVKFDNTNSGAVGSLTLNVNGTGAKPIKHIYTTVGPSNLPGAGYLRAGNMYQFLYDGAYWLLQSNYYVNTVGIYGSGALTAGTNGVKRNSLIMRDTEDTWTSLTTTEGTGTTKARYTGGLNPEKLLYMGSSSTYAAGATTGTCYDASAFDLRYSTNCGSTLTIGRPVYLVGTLTEGLFYLAATWWTQTQPTTEDGKTYIYVGIAYSTYQVYLTAENTLYQFYDGTFRTLREIEEMKAAKTATNYLSADNTGIMVADMTDGEQYTPSTVPRGVKNTFMDEDSFDVRDGQDVLASFGETSQIGSSDDVHLTVSNTGVGLLDYEGNKILFIGGESTTLAAVTRNIQWVAPETTRNIRISVPERCTRGTIEFHLYGYDKVIFTFGTAGAVEQTQGDYTCTISYDGERAIYVTNTPAHSCFLTYYVPVPDHISMLLGHENEATEEASAAIGIGLIANRIGQLVCGTGNTGNPDYLFAVGNGHYRAIPTYGRANSGFSDAFGISADGDAELALDTTASSGTIDAGLYDAVTALGWENDVIV